MSKVADRGHLFHYRADHFLKIRAFHMPINRRAFVAGVATAAVAPPFAAHATPVPVQDTLPSDRFDPWIEVDLEALRYNVGVLSRLAGGKPILAVIKNNAYGLGATIVARALDAMPEIVGFAVVKTEAALELADAGLRKPVLLMALFGESDGAELARRGVHFALCTDDGPERVLAASRAAGRPVAAHVYLDTGMSRMGVPYHRAMPFLRRVAETDISIRGTFMGFTEEPEFDREQLRRFLELAEQARAQGIDLGALHAASSAGIYHFPESHLDMVRPGISIYGAYPSNAGEERGIAELRPALRLKARVVRVEQLRVGDSVSYGRQYVADRPTWIATIPAGHTDGVPRQAVNGARVLINGKTYPAIGAVSASHTIIEFGDEPGARIGDVATLIGPDDPAIHPNALADASGSSVYDILMHLNPTLPKVLS